MTGGLPGAEFSRLVKITDIGRLNDVDIAANEDERAALAARFGLDAIDSLTARFTVRKAGRGLFRVSGRLTATVHPVCVVTLDAFETGIGEDFEAIFAEAGARETTAGLVEVDLDPEADDPEPLEGNAIDVGELVSQHLGLALDPYPHKPGVEAPLEVVVGADGEDTHSANPFAALERLKKGR